MFGSTKGGNWRNVITHVIWTNQKTKSFVYHWQRVHEMFDVTWLPAFVKTPDIICSILSLCQLCYPVFQCYSQWVGVLMNLSSRPLVLATLPNHPTTPGTSEVQQWWFLDFGSSFRRKTQYIWTALSVGPSIKALAITLPFLNISLNKL